MPRLIAAATFVLVLTSALAAQPPSGAAWLVAPVSDINSTSRREQHSEILDKPVLPGSVAKIATLIAALETHTIDARAAHLCRRVVTVNGRRYVCSHPDLKRPLTPAEALAYSCNDFFLSLAPRLPAASVEDVRTRLGFPRTPPGTDYPASLIGLDGARVTPRRLLEAFVRVVDPMRRDALRMTATTRAVLTEGLTGAARYGSASALNDRGLPSLAKTGTAPMPGGGNFGILLAATPAITPTRAVVVVAPGAAGRDAASIGADLLAPPASITLRTGDRAGTGRNRINTVGLEEYVARVVAGEGQPNAAPAARQALAIAARTFAIANRGRHAAEGFDLCETTHCQVTRAATASSRQAAEQTAGLVLTRGGRPAPVYYSAWCGGRSQVAANVWPDAEARAGDRPRADDACAGEPAWTSEVSAVEIERALHSAGRIGDRLRDLIVVRRDASGRVSSFRTDGFIPAEISGEDFRLLIGRVIGWERLKSTLVDVSRTARGFRFTGRGSGHGVGLCLLGAGTRAQRGASARQILGFYYPDLSVQPLSGNMLASQGKVLLAVPALEQGSRAEVLALATRARDEIAQAAGVAVPAELRVTVHPDVESFSRATGLPWWVAGATRGTAIHLLPLDVLRRQGQVERTIRHEVAHALLDGAFAGQSLWVREGAALTFASNRTRVATTSAAPCPSDASFRAATSAAALSGLYEQAERCFRAQLAAGRKWFEVSAPAPVSGAR